MENNLPESWELVKLVEQINFLSTGVKEYSGTRKYYSTGSIQENVNTPEGEFTFKNRPSRANRISVKGDVFQARMKATDKGILVDDKLHDQLFSTGFIQLRPYGNTYDNKLLYYLIKSEQFLTQKNEYATGSTQEALTDTGASEIEIPLPPLAEQQRIVAKLDAVFEKIESNKKRLEKIPVILKRFRQSVLAAAVSGRLTEDWRGNKDYDNDSDLPISWRLVKIDKLVNSTKTDLRTGPFGTALKKSEHKEVGIPVWGIESIGENGLFTGYNKIFVSIEKAKELKSFEVKGGNIIISRSGTVGEICILPEDIQYGLISTNLMKIVLNNEVILSKYFCWLFDGSQIVIDKLRELCTGSTRLFLTQTILKEIDYPLPPIDEQIVIIKRVNELIAFSDKLEARYNKAKAMLDKVPQSILAKAFRGELVSQNPNDEPASVLLDRIKEEKEKLKTVKNTRKKK
jgi:type I restriction enzyme S subunit